jgi:hypothetical protein
MRTRAMHAPSLLQNSAQPVRASSLRPSKRCKQLARDRSRTAHGTQHTADNELMRGSRDLARAQQKTAAFFMSFSNIRVDFTLNGVTNWSAARSRILILAAGGSLATLELTYRLRCSAWMGISGTSLRNFFNGGTTLRVHVHPRQSALTRTRLSMSGNQATVAGNAAWRGLMANPSGV